MTHPNIFLIFFKLFCTQNGIFSIFGYWWPKFWGSKNWFFSIFQKYRVKRSYRWIWPKNVFWRLWGPVSDNFQVAIVILSPYDKIQIFSKMRFLRYFWIFWCWSFWLQKSIKIVKNMKKIQKHVLYIPKIFLDSHNVILWSLYSVLREFGNNQKITFFPYWGILALFSVNWHFLLIFKFT